MSIQELPRATSRLLSSSQVLTTSASLVKELLDNAVDAKATSIDIVIAANSLDKIEVRDNGHGITPHDLSVIGKRGYTSKLRDFSELKSLGGLSLGFRGEALASAVALGDVLITSRVEGEVVATAIKLHAHGGISSQTSISHPVGTTVCVTNFFSRLPVRKQTALKDAKKTISRIQEMLKSYALARLNVRLTLKVLKAAKSSWSFAPRANEGTRGIVSHVLGRETAAQCVEMISTLFSPSHSDAGASRLKNDTIGNSNICKRPETLPQSTFIIQAFLPKPDADLTKISGAQYISIDSRPVSSTRGSPKKLISIYKTIISAMLVDDAPEKAKSPFLRLNIVCPAGSYDPNVEPAKDDVLFEDEEVLLTLIEAWLRGFYGDRILATIISNKTSKTQAEVHDVARSTNLVETGIINSDTLSSQRPGTDISEASDRIDENASGIHDPVSEVALDSGLTNRMGLHTSPEISDALPAVDQLRSGFNMSEEYPDEVELDVEEQASACDQMTADDARNIPTSCNSNRLNPWVIAKLNTPIVKKNSREATLAKSSGQSIGTRLPSTPLMIPTPRESSISRPSPAHRDVEPIERRLYETIAALDNSQSTIEGWLQQSSELSHDSTKHLYNVPLPSSESSDRARGFADIGSAVMDRDMSFDMLRSPPATQMHLAPRIPQNFNRPFRSPLKDAHLAISSAAEMKVKSLPSRRPQLSPAIDMIFERGAQNLVIRDEQRPEVHEALDFERRKEVATRKLREQLRRPQSSAEIPTTPGNGSKISSPNKNRYYAAVAALEIDQNQSTYDKMKDKTPDETCLPDDDPRAYLMRRQKSIAACSEKPSAGRRLKRTKTMLLPLETIPDRTELHNLSQVVSTNIGLVRQALLTLTSHDQYARSGNQARGLVMSNADIQAIELKLRNVVKNWMHNMASEEVDVVFDLGGLQGRSVAQT